MVIFHKTHYFIEISVYIFKLFGKSAGRIVCPNYKSFFASQSPFYQKTINLEQNRMIEFQYDIHGHKKNKYYRPGTISGFCNIKIGHKKNTCIKSKSPYLRFLFFKWCLEDSSIKPEADRTWNKKNIGKNPGIKIIMKSVIARETKVKCCIER